MSQTKYSPRLAKRFKDEIAPIMMKKFNYTSVMQVPRLQKICLNQGVNGATSDKKLVDIAVNEMTAIAGQKAVASVARMAISNFKLREGMPIGCRVTLRAERMFEFLDRLVSVSLPRVRDFKGINNKGFDGRGNYTLGIKEQIIFPEMEIDKVTRINGMDITFVTSAKTDEEAYALLEAFGMPFKKDTTNNTNN
ncbi:MAG: 50S ribosomal protein L5 [Bacteroidota bacterium]